MKTSRSILKSSQYCAREVKTLLQGLLVVELLRPSKTLWLVSAWASDVPVIDNRSGSFTGLCPAWSHRQVNLAEVLVELARRGSTIVLATNATDHNDWLIERLNSMAIAEGVGDRVRTSKHEKLHVKGILGDDFHFRGSMNFTKNGIEVNEEEIVLEIDRAEVARAQVQFGERFGR